MIGDATHIQPAGGRAVILYKLWGLSRGEAKHQRNGSDIDIKEHSDITRRGVSHRNLLKPD